MEATKDNLRRVMSRMPEITFLPGAPDTPEKLMGFVRALTRILRGLPVKAYTTLDDVVTEPGSLAFVGELPPEIHDDLDWVLMAIADNCERFPAPIDVFRLYSRFFTAANAPIVERGQDALEDR